MNKRRISACVAFVSLVSLMLGACEGTVPRPQVAAAKQETPVLTVDREQAIRKRILEVIDQANQAKNAQGLEAVMDGPALAIRTSELTVAASTGNLNPKVQIPETVDQVIIPTNTGWPRAVFAITTTTQDQQTRRLLVLRQASARENYKLWAVARVFPGVTLPRFEIPTLGSRLGEIHDKGLVKEPEEAIKQYADTLTDPHGDSSQYVADDYFQADLAKLTQLVDEAMKKNNGTQKQTFTPVPDMTAIVRSSDGGDLVVAQVDSEWLREAGADGHLSLPASDAERAFFGNATPSRSIRVQYVNVVVLYVPPESSHGMIQALAIERQPVKVEPLS